MDNAYFDLDKNKNESIAADNLNLFHCIIY